MSKSAKKPYSSAQGLDRKSRVPSLPRIPYVPQAIRDSDSYGPLSQKYDEYIEMFETSSDDTEGSFTRKKARSQVNIVNSRNYEIRTIHELKTPSKPIIHCYNASRDNVGNSATAKKSAPVKKISFVLPGLPQHQIGTHISMPPNKKVNQMCQASPLPASPPAASLPLGSTPSASLPSYSPRPVSPPRTSLPLVSMRSTSLPPVSAPPASPLSATLRTRSPCPGSPSLTLPLSTSTVPCIDTAPLSTTSDISTEVQPDMMEEQDSDKNTLQFCNALKTEIPMDLFVHENIVISWQCILAKGLTKETKEKLIKSYFIPSNCDLLLAPTLNPEVKVTLPDYLVKRDSVLMYKQNQLGIALSALASVIDMIISNETNKQKLLKPINDACRILCDSHFWETKTRRDIIVSSMNTNLKKALLATKRDKFLFGENVTEKIKAAKAEELIEAISALEDIQTRLRLAGQNNYRLQVKIKQS